MKYPVYPNPFPLTRKRSEVVTLEEIDDDDGKSTRQVESLKFMKNIMNTLLPQNNWVTQLKTHSS